MNLRYLKTVGIDGFILALTGAILLAYIWPAPGIPDSPLKLHKVAGYGVSLIFFFYGLKLSPIQLKQGLSNWKLHIVIQVITFIVFPALIILFRKFAGGSSESLLWTGTFFMATLPSTVSSSVVMVSIANGNVPAAIFNASLSSLLGVIITPLWMGVVITTGTHTPDIGESIIKLSFQVLLPVMLGVLLHPKFGSIAARNRHNLKLFDQTVILLIVYVSFCESFANKMFSGYSFFSILLLCLAMTALFFLIYSVTSLTGKLLKFRKDDYITAVFCGSKKSLVHGTVMAKVLFPQMTGLGVILLPLMIFHTLQLIASSILAQRFSR